MGPNTTTGHLSVIYSVECQTNFALRVLKPVLGPLHSISPLSLLNPFSRPAPDTVAVTPQAEQRDNSWIQSAASKLVWATGCTSWYIDARTGRNTMLYPDWQYKFWMRSIFFPYSRDFILKTSAVPLLTKKSSKKTEKKKGSGVVTSLGITVVVLSAAVLCVHKANGGDLTSLSPLDIESNVRQVLLSGTTCAAASWKELKALL